ncbi:MAG: GAF domain-containing protein [Deltaproteobacteria bacterium]|nr:GAF domain-containing protein [Deltaproteobacteria bacterium]
MDAAAAQGLESFAEVRAWLLDSVRPASTWRVHPRDDGTVEVARSRAVVTLIEPGQSAPDHFDHLLVVGPPPKLADALEELDDPRVHLLGLPCAEGVLARVVDAALEAADAFARARVTDQLLEIGMALNAARDPARVLELILQHARSITGADAGSIYLVDEEAGRLRFEVSVNDSVETNLQAHTLVIGADSVVGASVLRRRVIRSPDLYQPTPRPDESVRHDRSIDKRFGYQTRSMITAPMISPEGRVLAVIQLINAKLGPEPLRTATDFDERVRPFTAEDERLCSSLASQAAVALESARLYAEIQSLFEGFVRASVHAIEQRDPTTSGHSQRVANLTVALAQAADGVSVGRFASTRFSPEQLREIEYAGLLHDFGKVGVREEVLVKAKKLYPHQLALVQARFGHMRQVLEVDRLRAQLALARKGLPDDPALEREHQQRQHELARMMALVLEANEPSVLPTEASSQLAEIAGHQFVDADGKTIALLQGDELDALLIRRGSLTDAERVEIQHHVTHTYDFLVRIPWGRSLSKVPEIAAKHHEYLDGSGYPSALPSTDIPLQARMMTVSDIFDALTASDRPYKKAVPVPLALDILHAEHKRGKIDPDVLELFIGTKLYEGPQGT